MVLEHVSFLTNTADVAQKLQGKKAQYQPRKMSNQKIKKKKDRERFLLERFIEDANLQATIVENDREEPDFIIQINEEKVGVEITEIFISHEKEGATQQAQEAVSSQITEKAQRLYQTAGGPPAHVSILFGIGKNLRDIDRDTTAQILCDYILSLKLAPSQVINFKSEDDNSPLPDEISFVHACGVPSLDMSHWCVARAGWVANLAASKLQDRIDIKAKLLPKYQNSVSENWLVVVADATKPSGQIRANDDFDPRAIQSPFARTFFYRYPESALELGVKI